MGLFKRFRDRKRLKKYVNVLGGQSGGNVGRVNGEGDVFRKDLNDYSSKIPKPQKNVGFKRLEDYSSSPQVFDSERIVVSDHVVSPNKDLLSPPKADLSKTPVTPTPNVDLSRTPVTSVSQNSDISKTHNAAPSGGVSVNKNIDIPSSSPSGVAGFSKLSNKQGVVNNGRGAFKGVNALHVNKRKRGSSVIDSLDREKILDDYKPISRMSKRPNFVKFLIPNFIISLVVSIISFYVSKKFSSAITGLIISFCLLSVYFFASSKLKRYQQIVKMEAVFPDFLQLVSSNLRAGVTLDRAILLGSRKEFAPLDEEILQVGKDIFSGKKIETALKDMSKRIGSGKISRTIDLLISGIRAGGNVATLLEETASNTREKNFVEKKASSSVLMYIIFIGFAVGVGAPVLFGLSAVLVGVLTDLLSGIPELPTTSLSLPIALTSISISPSFITYFSLVFLIFTNVLGSIVMGLVMKGSEREGLKFIVPLTMTGLLIFFGIKIFLSKYFANIV